MTTEPADPLFLPSLNAVQWIEFLRRAPAAIAMFDRDMRYLMASQRYSQDYRLPCENLVGRSHYEVFPDLPPRWKEIHARCLEGAVERAEADPFPRADGTVDWVNWEIHPWYETSGEVGGLILLSEVVNAHRWQQDALASPTKCMTAMAAGQALSRISMSPALAAGEVEIFARELTERASMATGVERASVWLFNGSESVLRCVDLYEATPGRHTAGMVLVESEYETEFAALKTSPYVDASDALADPRTAGYRETYLKPFGITSVLDSVISVSGRHLGIVSLEHVNRRHTWQPDEIEFACRLGDKVGLALGNRKARLAQARWQAGLEQTVRAIASTVEIRDPYTAGHQERVASLCEAIGRELGFDENRIRGLVLAAMIHDVGKARVPADILNKPSTLNHHELQLVRTHAEAGYEILRNVRFPWPIARMVLQHHERLDGSGYPRGLKGDEILLEARIIAVADVVEAMASHRPYRAALGIDAALAEIEAHAGTRYDEAVVRACVQVFREGRFSLDRPESS